MAEIYQLYNSINGKSYVGQTIESVVVRWRKHQDDARKGKPTRICKALRKYGPETFERQILSSRADSREERDNLEKVWIILLQTTNENLGYNITPGGNSRYVGPEGLAKMSAKLKGRKLTNEHRKNIAESSRRRWADPEYKARVSKSISKGFAGKPKSSFHRQRMSEGRKGMKLSAEHRLNISIGLNKFYRNKGVANAAEKN